MPVNATWYRFIELRDQKWVEFERRKTTSRKPILAKFSNKLQKLTPWGTEDLMDTSEGGKVGTAIQETLKKGMQLVRYSILVWKINYVNQTNHIIVNSCDKLTSQRLRLRRLHQVSWKALKCTLSKAKQEEYHLLQISQNFG